MPELTTEALNREADLLMAAMPHDQLLGSCPLWDAADLYREAAQLDLGAWYTGKAMAKIQQAEDLIARYLRT